MFGIIIITIGGFTWVCHRMRMEQKTPPFSHSFKLDLDTVIETAQVLVMVACVIFVFFAVGHYDPLGLNVGGCISAEQGAC
jgi:hypothetical protein